MQNFKKIVEFKGGNFTISIIYLYNSQPEIIKKTLKNKINKAPLLLQNAPVIINVAFLPSNINWKKMQYAVMSTGLQIIGVIGCKDKNLKNAIIKTGLPIFSSSKTEKDLNVNLFEKSKIVNTHIRSGQQVYSKNQDLIILNNVSSGAELVSNGNIHIYGKMYGRALAGASGDTTCQVFCTYLSSELISIAGAYWTMEDIPIEFNKKPARLFLKDGNMQIKNLNYFF